MIETCGKKGSSREFWRGPDGGGLDERKKGRGMM